MNGGDVGYGGQALRLTRRRFAGVAAASFGQLCLTGCDLRAADRVQAASVREPTLSPAPAPGPSDRFPLHVSRNGRHLVQSNGVPFPLLGRTSWFVLSLTPADYGVFLDDTAAKGFTAVEFHVINHDPRGNKPPFANDGSLLPFTRTLDGRPWTGRARSVPDFTAVNERYWQFVDGFLSACASRQLTALMFPAYVGYRGTCDGWMTEMLLNGPERMRAYGAFLARRYAAWSNIVWMLGGDDGTGSHAFTPAQRDVEQALIDGMKSVAGQQSMQFAAEWDSESIGTDQSEFQRHLTLNAAYSHAGRTAAQTRRAYRDSTRIMPAFLLEGAYDEEGPPHGARRPDGSYYNPAATPPVRRFTWRAWLSGPAGYVDGNGFVWAFKPGWQAHLDSQGAQDLARLNAYILSVPWYALVPDGAAPVGTLIAAGAGTIDEDDHVVAAATPDGALLVAYFSPAHASSVTVDMTKLRAPALARWFDPTSGAYKVHGTVANSAPATFAPPGRNSAGDGDWVLRLDG